VNVPARSALWVSGWSAVDAYDEPLTPTEELVELRPRRKRVPGHQESVSVQEVDAD